MYLVLFKNDYVLPVTSLAVCYQTLGQLVDQADIKKPPQLPPKSRTPNHPP